VLLWGLTVATALVGCGPPGGARVEPSSGDRLSEREPAPASIPQGPTCSSPQQGRGGALAIIEDQSLYLLDPATCRRRFLLGGGVSGPVRFSPNGRWLATREGVVIEADGRRVVRPLGGEVAAVDGAWAWAPVSDRLAGATQGGGLLEGTPGQNPRRRLPEGWGARRVSFLPEGRSVLVVRQVGPSELWILDGSSTAPRMVHRLPAGQEVRDPPILSADGRWALITHGREGTDKESLTSVSLEGDRPTETLEATNVPDAATDFCGNRVVWVARRPGGAATSIRTATPPNWRPRTLASGELHAGFLACTPDDTGVAVASGGRSDKIEVVRFDRASTTTVATWPGPDGLRQARWSPDGELVAFVASGPLALGELSAGPATGVLFFAGAQEGPVPRPLAEVELDAGGATFDWGPPD
jgi:hypothetical protein